MKNNVTVVFDGQAGSCGKGKICGYLALKDKINLSINNWNSNAGHTWVDNNGDKIILQHIPSGLMNSNTKLMIGPGAAITSDILINEIRQYSKLLGERKIFIHPRAMIILPKHIEKEKQIIRSGSTFKGGGAAQAEKILRVPGIQLMKEYYNKLPNDIKTYIHITDTAEMVNTYVDKGKSAMVEGSQGFDLDINYGLQYPHVTSRQCNAGQLIADCGISPKLVNEIIMIIRPYPIRISNHTDIGIDCDSGDYNGSKEITWQEVKKRSGAPQNVDLSEYTTVTKKMRRVFEMNWARLKYAVLINRPTQIALNFAQHIDYNAFECKQWENLSGKVKDFISKVENETNTPITLIGTGSKNKDMIDLRK